MSVDEVTDSYLIEIEGRSPDEHREIAARYLRDYPEHKAALEEAIAFKLSPVTNDRVTLRVISLGAGVQSSTMLLMALNGEFAEMPDCAIFADTQWEPKAVYEHLGYLATIAATKAFPILQVTKGNIRAQALHAKDGEKRSASLPMHIRNKDGLPAMQRRQCTRDFKIEPLEKKIRELMGVAKGQRVPKDKHCEQWVGISIDEASRMRNSKHKWSTLRYPLIEKRMSRKDCIAWLEAHDYKVPPKSACIGCPFHDDHYWRKLKTESPEEWADAVEFDKLQRHQHRMNGEAFLHRSLVPLDEVDLRTAEERGQLNLFENDCSGLCGV